MKGIATIFTFLGALAVAAPVAADDLARWTFENDTISGSGQNSGPYSVDLGWPGIYGGQALGHHASASTAWSSPAGNGSIKSFSSTYWATGDYYQFQTSTIGYQNIAISWHQTSSSTGPTSFALRYSTDGSSFFDLLPGYTVGTAGWSSGSQNTGSIFGPVSGPPLLNNQPNVYFRLVSLVTPSNTAGTDRVDNIVITGVVSSQAYACCLPVNYRCITVPQATCQALNGTFYPGMSCGAPLPTEYSWVFNPDQTIINGAWNQNAQTVEDSTPIHRVTIDLQLTGTTGPLYITVEHLGWVVALWNGVCQSAVGMDVTFDDDGTIPACTGLTGGVSIKPSGFGGGSLSDFRGMEVGGPWILKIYRVSGTSLVLARWSVHVQFINDPDPCILIPTGACCKTDGTCAHLTQQDCMMQGGYQWQYAVPCSFAGCTPSGACCQPDGSCAITSQLGCLAPGVWHSHHASCTPNPCPQSTGACCLPNGHCTIETEMVCLQLGGAYYPGETCGTVLAAQYHYLFPIGMPMPPGMESQNEQDLEDSTPVGPVWIDLHLIGILGPLYITLEHLGTTVVLWNGVCQSSDGMDIVFDDDAVGGTINCTNLTGGSHIRPSDAGGGHLSDFWGIEFGGPWIIRVYVSGTEILILERWSIWVQFLDETFVCVPVPMGACCLPDGTCIHVSEADCTSQGGTEWHYAVPCSFANCPQPPTGACCKGGVCVPDLTFAQCTAQGGVWQGAGSDCFPNPCVPINYYWDATTAERGGDGYSGQWIYYPNAPDGPWYNMWWSNEYALNRLKDVTLTFTLTFPSGSGYLEAALVRSTPDWTNISRPPLADEEEYIVRDNLGIITTPGTYTFPAQLLYCPTWVSIDVRGYSYAVEGTIIHTCLAATTGACCVGWTCTIETPAACAAKLGRYLGNGTTCDGNPCAITDVVVCEPQGGGDPNNPNPAHPATYWYDVTPGGGFGRCDFHVRVYDPNPANYTNPSLPAATWQFQVHQVGSEWWASWWDPNCVNAIFGPNPTRFQFTHPNAAVWGDWRTTIGASNDPNTWVIDESGNHPGLPDGSGQHVHVPSLTENWYWKDCNGAADGGYMSDFDQRQDFNNDGLVEAGYCGPTAVANSIWWFDCKFPAAGIVPVGWTPGQLIQDLAQRMDTNDQNPPSPNGHPGPFSGTYLDDMKSGINAYLTAQGVNNLLYEHTQLNPTYDYISAEVQKSQDVTLLVGFWHIVGVQQVGQGMWQVTWQRTGGHYLTVAGVDPANNRVALSDPDGDFAEHGYSGVVRPAGIDHNHDGDNDPTTVYSFRDPNYLHTVHNTDTYASHDYYALLPSISPGGKLALVLDGDPLAYGDQMHIYHEGENDGPFASGSFGYTDPNEYQLSLLWPSGQIVQPAICQYYTEVEAAVVVSPFEACGPEADAQSCKPVVCPVQTQQCLPKKVRHYLPQIVFPLHGTDTLSPTGGYFQIMDPMGTTQTYTITEGPPNNTVVNRQDPITVGDHREIEMEMLQLDLVGAGGGGGGGGAYVHLGTYHPSTGHVVGPSTPGNDYPADSFFDVYVEIDIPDMGMTGLHNLSPIPLEDRAIHAVPPLGTQFQTPTGWSGVELYTAEGYPTGFHIVGVTHILPPDWQVIECQCMDANACHSQLNNGHSCVGGCPLGYTCNEVGMSSPDGTYADLWCECWCVFMGDMDHNYAVNGMDIQAFATCAIYGGPDCGCGDFNHSGAVDIGDVNDFVTRLLTP